MVLIRCNRYLMKAAGSGRGILMADPRLLRLQQLGTNYYGDGKDTNRPQPEPTLLLELLAVNSERYAQEETGIHRV